MGQDNGTDQPNKPAFWRDPRLYQIISLATLLLYGLFWLQFDISIWQIAITLGVAHVTQYAGTRYFNRPSFDPKSALISSLSLCILLRTNDLAVAALAAFIAIGSKFVVAGKTSMYSTQQTSHSSLSLPVVSVGSHQANGGKWLGSAF